MCACVCACVCVLVLCVGGGRGDRCVCECMGVRAWVRVYVHSHAAKCAAIGVFGLWSVVAQTSTRARQRQRGEMSNLQMSKQTSFSAGA